MLEFYSADILSGCPQSKTMGVVEMKTLKKIGKFIGKTVYMTLFSTIFSIAFFNILIILFMQGILPAKIILLYGMPIMIIQLIISIFALAKVALTGFQVNTVWGFTTDIIKDVLMLIFATQTFQYYLGSVTMTYAWFIYGVLIISIVVGFMDFVISLNQGAAKLLEMNKEHIKSIT